MNEEHELCSGVRFAATASISQPLWDNVPYDNLPDENVPYDNLLFDNLLFDNLLCDNLLYHKRITYIIAS